MNNKPIAMHTGRDLHLSVGKSRETKKVVNKKAKWSTIVKALQNPTITSETYEEYKSLTRDDALAIKDVGYFVGGHFRDGKRNNKNIISRDIITLDADHCSSGFVDLVKKKLGHLTYVIHSTHGHSSEDARLRLIFPLTKSIPPNQYAPISRKLAEMIDIECFDNTTDQPARAMFWPSTPCDVDYVFKHNEGDWVDPVKILDEYDDWQDQSQWPYSKKSIRRIYNKKDKAQDPREKTGLIGAFCRVYDIHTAIAEFLPETYVESDSDRYTYLEGSSANGVVVYDGGLFLFSHHESDPCSDQLVNSFDLVRLHKFGELDKDSKPETPTNRLKSYKAMLDFAQSDKAVRIELNKELIEGFDVSTKDDEKGLKGEEEQLEWLANLDRTQEGKVKSTLSNTALIVENDCALKGIYYNKLLHSFVKMSDMPWVSCEDAKNGDEWTDFDDASLRSYIEKKYGLVTAKDKAVDAVLLLQERRGYHPITKYFDDLKWDGVPRIDALLIDHLGVGDSQYTRTVSRKFMCGAVARVIDPGIKFDFCLILEGGQGIGKSTFVKTLVGDDTWFGDDITQLHGKEVIESIQGRWIIELSELQSFSKADIEHIKAFMSRTADKARMAYGRHAKTFKRQVVFVGTTNDAQYLKDDTGNRRFWPVKCGVKKVDFVRLSEVRDQLWAEAVHRYKEGEKLYIDDPEIEKLALEEQAERHAEDEWIGLISDWLERPIEDGFDLDEANKLRDRVCAMQIYVECLGGHKERHTRAISNRISRAMDRVEGWEKFPRTMKITGYGDVKGWKKLGSF